MSSDLPPKLFFIFFLSLLPVIVSGQNKSLIIKTDSIPVNIYNKYVISSFSIIPGSEQIQIRGILLSDDNYSIDYGRGVFSISRSFPHSILDTVIISYLSLNLSVVRENYKKKLVIQTTGADFRDTVFAVSTRNDGLLTGDAIFGEGIQKSGTIIRGFQFGTNKDLTLQSGLRLQLSGKLSDDIEIVAALTDESSPIQPEGNTESLEELDKVFIQLRHKNASGVFGDYDFTSSTGQFGTIFRRLQGLQGEVFFDNYNAKVAIAGSRGKFNTNTFTGQDGVQGPYRLSGSNGERDIIIISGTEKVFLDGELMKRGDNNDYIIDYSNAEITFTTRRLIVSTSRISIDFEYSDRKYSRNFLSGETSVKLFDNKLKLGVLYAREGDNKDSPVDLLLTDSDIKLLESAGGDRKKAVKPGVSLAEPDSLGRRRGAYELVDSLIAGESVTFYRYAPGADSAIYNVSFSYSGEQQGDYIRRGIGQFFFVGKNAGNYLPVVYLPLPELKQNLALNLEYELDGILRMKIELGGSRYDLNQFSSDESSKINGYSRQTQINILPRDIEISGLELGNASLSVKERYVEGKFSSLDRFNDVDFSRNYNTGLFSGTANEQLIETRLDYRPVKQISVASLYGYLDRGGNLKSDRYNNSMRMKWENGIEGNFNFDYVKSDVSTLSSRWLKQRGELKSAAWIINPVFEYTGESRSDNRAGTDSVSSSSYYFLELAPGFESVPFKGLSVTLKYVLREDELPVNGILVKESDSRGGELELKFDSWKELNSSVRITVREKKYSRIFRERGSLDQQTILIKSRNRVNLFDRLLNGDIFYEVSTQRTAVLQRVFVKVEKGRGNYIYIGDRNGNGVTDENDFEPTLFDGDFIAVTVPSDELFPVIDLKTGFRLKIDPGQINAPGFAGAILKNITAETVGQADENSRETELSRIYLLDFGSFLNPATTIKGSQFLQQDIFILENNPGLNFRLRFSQRRSLSQFSGGAENGLFSERSIRTRLQLVKEFSLQIDYLNNINNLSAGKNSNRNRAIGSDELSIDFNYRPDKNVEFGLKIRFNKSTDRFPETPTEVDINSQSVRLNLFFAGSGRGRIEIERTEIIPSATQNYIPFELTGGNATGKNYYWRTNFDYRISVNLQISAGYEGRLQGAGRVIHTARAEARAYF